MSASGFQKVTLLIAAVIMIIMLVVVGYLLRVQSQHMEWPPNAGNCPDYWSDVNGDGSKCINTHHLGTCELPMDLYSVEQNTSIHGNDLKTMGDVSLDDCRGYCTRKNNCTGFVYNDKNQFCWLKGEGIENSDAVSQDGYTLYRKQADQIEEPSSVDFTSSYYTGSDAACHKYRWAKNCGVTWDGVTTLDQSPCETTVKK